MEAVYCTARANLRTARNSLSPSPSILFQGVGSFENPSILEAVPRHNADRHSAQVQGLHVHDAHSVASCS